jgi:hypothetical protein
VTGAVIVALLPELLPQQARISQLAIEVTLDPPARPTRRAGACRPRGRRRTGRA